MSTPSSSSSPKGKKENDSASCGDGGYPRAIGFGMNYSHNMGPSDTGRKTLTHESSKQTIKGYGFWNDSEVPWSSGDSSSSSSDNDDPLVQVATSCSSSFFLTKSGRVYTCGTLHGRVVPQWTQVTIQLPLECVEISAGRHFALARMAGGLAVCAWGAGHFGQLGLGNLQSPFIEHPTVLEGLLPHVVGSPIEGISAGYWHAMAVTKAGQVFSWGCNRSGQCGHKPNKDPPTISTPQPIRFETSGSSSNSGSDGGDSTGPPKITKVSAGRSHSAAITDQGAVYCWGACQHGQCAVLTRRRGGFILPRVVETLKDVKVVDISAGDAHTLALTTGGRLFAWGGGFEGQLGMGSVVQLNPRPKIVGDLDFVAIAAGQQWKSQQQQSKSDAPPTPPADDPNAQHELSFVPKIVSVVATGNSSIAISSSGHVYVWGCNDVENLGVPQPDPSTMIYADVGLPAPPKTSSRQFHTFCFDSSHNIALPVRVDALSEWNVKSVAASPTFMWCLGNKRTEEEQSEGVIGQTLYEVQEGKRHRNLKTKPPIDPRSPTPATVLSKPTSPTPMACPPPLPLENNTTHSTLDPPEMKDGSQVDFGDDGTDGGEEGSTSRHSQGFLGDLGPSASAKSLVDESPATRSKKRFSLKSLGNMVRRSSLKGNDYNATEDNGIAKSNSKEGSKTPKGSKRPSVQKALGKIVGRSSSNV